MGGAGKGPRESRSHPGDAASRRARRLGPRFPLNGTLGPTRGEVPRQQVSWTGACPLSPTPEEGGYWTCTRLLHPCIPVPGRAEGHLPSMHPGPGGHPARWQRGRGCHRPGTPRRGLFRICRQHLMVHLWAPSLCSLGEEGTELQGFSPRVRAEP